MPESELVVDLAGALGAEEEPSHQQLSVYIPDRDREGKEIGNQRSWVLEAAALLATVGGGVTIMPPVEGGWFDDSTGDVIWERPVIVYTFVKPERFHSALPKVRRFLHRMGRETRQGEVAFDFDGTFYRIREFDS